VRVRETIMRFYIVLTTLLLFVSPLCALTCAAPNGSPRDQISDAYDKSDLVALAVQNSVFRYGELAIKAVWKGNPEPIINVKFTWANLPTRGNFVVFASKTKGGYVDEVICLMLWGQREELLRDVYGSPVKLSSLRNKAKV
jgi:hypothetical protein